MLKKDKSAPQYAVPSLTSAWVRRSRAMQGIASAFCVGDQAVVDSSVGASDGLLPLVAWHADNIYRYAMGGRPIGLSYRSDSKAMLGFRVDLTRIQQPTSEVMCFVIESLEDIFSNSPKSALVNGAADLSALANRFKSELHQAMQQSGIALPISLRSTAAQSAP